MHMHGQDHDCTGQNILLIYKYVLQYFTKYNIFWKGWSGFTLLVAIALVISCLYSINIVHIGAFRT